ncbi:chemotaxis protein CheB [Deinococcus psychrotolerans]|uniref:protein-glutamate methylesterase n=1 Tax=Deinococcus psychrotolerans TaxID=2489213 RepID=A0A3G8YQY8_9DEIO|nr:chemotaxis protein CheB [Deinococcus psychrotolerans]AZI44121.1 chemotaxis protein CheB [Deinococcus psychrotolerans]
MLPFRLVVIGASAGGLPPLTALAAGLPADFPAAICIVMHIPAYAPSYLAEILGRAGPLPASQPANGDPILPGRIYCASPDHHLLIENGQFNVTKGPKENRVRPAVDTLFRSAAYSEGPNVIGVVLSGLLDDGTSGLWTIKHFGGVAVVQDPQDAEYDSMPKSAVSQVKVDHTVCANDLAALLIQLVAAPMKEPGETMASDEDRQRVEVEVSIASSAHAFRKGVMAFGKVTPQTCPECGGILVEIKEGGFTRYRCHTGHAYTGDSLLVSVTEAIENKLWRTMRALEEASMLLENTSQNFAAAGNTWLAQEYSRKAAEMEARTRLIFQDIVDNRSLSAEQLDHDVSKER